MSSKGSGSKASSSVDESEWIIEIKQMLGCVYKKHVRVCSISRVPGTLRKDKKEAYSPKIVSIGPFHHRTRVDLKSMEQTKWRYMLELLLRVKTEGKVEEKLKSCAEEIRWLDHVVRASYGEDIKWNPDELAVIMTLDGCYILELLLKLYYHVTGNQPFPEDVPKTLSDFMLLENQIPFIVLQRLHEELSKEKTSSSFPSFDELAQSLFDCCVDEDILHFLHLVHKSSTHNNNESNLDKTDARKELMHCARKLLASGIEIQKCTPGTSSVHKKLKHSLDKFDLNIEFDKSDRKLTIPPLRIKEGTEVKWRNLIAWEQSGVDQIGYKFTTYALFFSGLICSVHDIEILKEKKVIKVDGDTMIKNEDLLAMFTTIVNGVQNMDSRYSELCKSLNAAVDCVRFLRPRLWWHYWRRVLPWLHEHFKKWILDFKKDYMRNPWVFMGVIAATILLGLTIAQTVFAAIGLRH